MNWNRSRALFRAIRITLLFFALVPAVAQSGTPAKSVKPRPGTVWILFASSSECPRCEGVTEFLRVLRSKYPIRTKKLDIDKDRDRELFERLEAIHAQPKFAIPLVMAGDSILMGESEISGKLEAAVKKLARRGGSPLPYMGPPVSDKKSQAERLAGGVTGRSPSQRESPNPKCPSCERRWRPPSFSEELGKIKGLLNRLF